MTLDSEPIGENNQAPYASGESHAQTSQSNPDVPRTPSIPSSPPPKTHCEITCKTEKDFWDHVTTGVEILGIILLAVYTTYTIKMYGANKIAADAAKSAADTARDALEAQTRPWLFIASDPTIETFRVSKVFPAEFKLALKNVGASPAMNLIKQPQFMFVDEMPMPIPGAFVYYHVCDHVDDNNPDPPK